jgi:hypothetical protein
MPKEVCYLIDKDKRKEYEKKGYEIKEVKGHKDKLIACK